MTIKTIFIRGKKLTHDPTTLIICIMLLSGVLLSGCISDKSTYTLSCHPFEYSNDTDSEDEVVHYQNLSSENQSLFKKGINGTEVEERFIPSLNERFIKYENNTYDCDIFNPGV